MRLNKSSCVSFASRVINVSGLIYGLKKNGVGPVAVVNEETETIVATGVILAGVPCVDQIDISQFRTGDKLKVDAEKGIVEKIR